MSLTGAIAAAATPLRDDGRLLDEDSFAPLVQFLASSGIDGLLACGTTGESLLLSMSERLRAAELFVATRPPGFQVAVHAGAQTTSDSISLAAHARDVGTDAVAAIAPPFSHLDEEELTRHFARVAAASHPLPFYAYEYAERSGYSIPVTVIQHLRQVVPNLRGMKVSDAPLIAVEPYLGIEGLDVFIGSEALVLQAMELGAVGSVSGLATAFPEVITALVHDRSPAAGIAVESLRERLYGIPFPAGLKEVLVALGVCATADVRPPLRGLTDEERAHVLQIVPQLR